MTDNKPTPLEIQDKLTDLLGQLKTLSEQVDEVTRSGPFLGAIAKQEMTHEAKDSKDSTSSRYNHTYMPLNGEPYEQFLARVPHSRMTSAMELLHNRMNKIKDSTKNNPSLLDIERTHYLPINHHFKPVVQMAEKIVSFNGTIIAGKCTLAGLPHKYYNDSALWDFRLVINGTFTDEDLEIISIEVNNGAVKDAYRRILYTKPASINGTTEQFIPLDFWMKDRNRAAFMSTWTSFAVHINKVPDTVNSIRLVARQIFVDPFVADIYSRRVGFNLVQTHTEQPLKNKLRFNSQNITLNNYRIYSPNKPIQEVLESINGVTINDILAMNKVTMENRCVEFDLVCPISMKYLYIDVIRKTDDPLLFVAEPINFLLISDGSCVLRYINTDEVSESS